MTVTTRAIRTSRRIEGEKELIDGNWFDGFRALNPMYWLSDQQAGFRKTAFTIERERDSTD
jgi:hypothetical protein